LHCLLKTDHAKVDKQVVEDGSANAVFRKGLFQSKQILVLKTVQENVYNLFGFLTFVFEMHLAVP
jgi:hypothetical protein